MVSKVTEPISLVFSLLIPSSTCPDEVWGSEMGRDIALEASWSHWLRHTGWHFLDEAFSLESCKPPIWLVPRVGLAEFGTDSPQPIPEEMGALTRLPILLFSTKLAGGLV